MSEKLGIPYMGSKRKLASDILQKITQRHIGITDFYDLFGGGGSISFTAIRDYRFNGSRLYVCCGQEIPKHSAQD